MNQSGLGHFVALSSALCLSAWLASCGSSSSSVEGDGGGSSSGGDVSAGAGGRTPMSGGVSGSAGQAGGGTPDNAGTSSAGGASSDAGAGGAPSGVPNLAAIMAEYHSYQPQTDEPEPVSAYIFGLCRLPTLPEREFAESEHGDGRYLQDWANDLAVSGIGRRGAPAFAPGAIIVKEKYVPALSAGELELAALGFMIKREPGFAPEHGDWDYAYWEQDLGVIATAEQSTYCAGCHASAAETDHVFVDGLKP